MCEPRTACDRALPSRQYWKTGVKIGILSVFFGLVDTLKKHNRCIKTILCSFWLNTIKFCFYSLLFWRWDMEIFYNDQSFPWGHLLLCHKSNFCFGIMDFFSFTLVLHHEIQIPSSGCSTDRIKWDTWMTELPTQWDQYANQYSQIDLQRGLIKRQHTKTEQQNPRGCPLQLKFPSQHSLV